MANSGPVSDLTKKKESHREVSRKKEKKHDHHNAPKKDPRHPRHQQTEHKKKEHKEQKPLAASDTSKDATNSKKRLLDLDTNSSKLNLLKKQKLENSPETIIQPLPSANLTQKADLTIAEKTPLLKSGSVVLPLLPTQELIDLQEHHSKNPGDAKAYSIVEKRRAEEVIFSGQGQGLGLIKHHLVPDVQRMIYRSSTTAEEMKNQKNDDKKKKLT